MAAKVVFRVHALPRMFERGIGVDDVAAVIEGGETIETYPGDQPYPSRLMMSRAGARHLHVVVADNLRENEIIVVTVYEPDSRLWEDDFRRRKP